MEQKAKKSFFNKFLDFVEVGGNKLPHPVTLFFILSLIIIVVSEICVRTKHRFVLINKKQKLVGNSS